MNVSDYIFDFLIKKEVDTVFEVPGEQIIWLNDALAKRPQIKAMFSNHEETCGICANAYSRLTNKLGVAVVNAGTGSLSIINGLVGGWCDSAPMMIISGQAPLNFVKYQEECNIRQFGTNAINIRQLVENVTKFFATVDDPINIQYYMEKAYYLATTGRPGPVWIEVPLDIQEMQVPRTLLFTYNPKNDDEFISDNLRKALVKRTIDLLMTSKRPLVIAGQGVSSANARNLLIKFIEKYNIPIITTRLGIDLITSDHPLYIGRPGNFGDRGANVAVQNADLILAIGSRLSTDSIGHYSKNFGKNAKKIIVDIDKKELLKPSFEVTLKINDDAKLFLQDLLTQKFDLPDYNTWLSHCQKVKYKYPVITQECKNSIEINSYHFTDKLCHFTDKNTTVVVDFGSCFHIACQAWKIKPGQRFITTGGLSSNGWWVAGIGACIANNKKKTIILTGDGSFHKNIQELSYIKHNNLPIKIFVFDNNGHLLIRQKQKKLMNGRLFGESEDTGLCYPKLMKIAKAYAIKWFEINTKEEIDEIIQDVLKYKGPAICRVKMPHWQPIIPRVPLERKYDGERIYRNIEDMYPYLTKDQMNEILLDN